MPTPPVTSDVRGQLLRLYDAGRPIAEIAADLGISRPTLYKYLHVEGRAFRYAPRPTHTVWHEAFNELTDEAAYWVGLLITDGAIVGGRVKLSLKAQDTPTLERFKAFVQTSAPIEVARKGSRVVRFSSIAMCSRLKELNVIPRKSYVAEAPSCLLDNRHFWRGAIDGDGSLSPRPLSSPYLSLCGASSARLLTQWAALCKGVCGFDAYPKPRVGKPQVSDVILYGHSAMTVAHWLYQGCSPESPAMERKLAAYHEMCRAHGKRDLTAKGSYVRGRKTDRA